MTRPVTCRTTLIDVAGVRALAGAALFDCRFDLADVAAGERAFGRGHLPGARYLHLDRDLSGVPTGANGRHPLPDRAVLAARLAALGLRRGQQVVAYDDAGGMVAARAWWLLRWLGHEAVAVLDGGMRAWEAAGLPLEAGAPPEAAPGDFTASGEPAMPVVAADRVLGVRCLLDARAPSRFRGEPHPLDPVTGHIPGAANRFFGDNLDGGGRFRPAEELRREYQALLAGADPAEVAVYCGSGVSAAHDLLAMAHAGLPGAALYPGSWSEWIADPARPVERG